MDQRDITLVHCVEIVCPHCGHIVRVARCQCDLDAEHLVHLYRREIILYDLECPHCDRPYLDPEAVRKEGSILVFRWGRGLDVVPEPDYCPHKDRCPGSDCCEEGERCAKSAGRG